MNALKDKVALVFGAASGIGHAVVTRFQKEGATVMACGLPTPPFADALLCDVAQEEAVVAAVATALGLHGRIDILVNAAGIIANDDAADILDDVWMRQHQVNLGGTMRTMRAVLPHMLARGAGSVVNIASVAAFNASAGAASYAASKAGVVALTRSAAHAYGHRGVRVNALCPGWVDTPMSAKEMVDMAQALGITEAQARDRTVARIALQRMARPEEMAAICLFLASDESSFVTGAALVADGGARLAASARGI